MMQTNIRYPNGTYLPYAAASIVAFALQDSEIRETYALKEVCCMRETPQSIVDRLVSPAVFAFSCYVWNTEFNKAVAALVKKTYPECTVIFGGHNIPENDGAFLSAYPFVDILIFGEGEKPFKGILESLSGRASLKDVNNVAFRENGEIVLTARAQDDDISLYPSPYTMGLLDGILLKYPDTDFSAILETNRGCPYHCAFCDWCEQRSKIRSFPMERIRADILWMAEHKIEFCYCADANFGILKRDDSIIDFVTACKQKYGYPRKFRVNFAKHNNDTVFNITKKLETAGLNKGATISFQSMNPDALKSIGRENMSVSHFSALMERYQAAGIATYTEIILGLPGESYDDFCRGIGRLLAAGQHTTLFIYNCEVIENSQMASPEYMQKNGIRTAQTTLYVRHNAVAEDEIAEHSRSVVSTDKMNVDDWVKANLFSVLIQSCHSMGLLRFFALWLYNEKGVLYEDFYQGLQRYAAQHPDSLIGGVYADFAERFYSIARGNGTWSCIVPEAGNVSWPYEEAFYIRLLLKKEAFYEDAVRFLSSFSIEDDIFSDILSYQKTIVKEPGTISAETGLQYDLVPYFDNLMRCKITGLKKRRNRIYAYDENVPAQTEEFMRVCVWFGRSVQRNLFSGLTAEYGG